MLWDHSGAIQEGVFIPRRDTNSKINRLLSGRVFPGEHHIAEFKVHERANKIELSMNSEDVMFLSKLLEEYPNNYHKHQSFVHWRRHHASLKQVHWDIRLLQMQSGLMD